MASTQSFDLSPAVAAGSVRADDDSPPLRAPSAPNAPRSRVSHITLHALQQVGVGLSPARAGLPSARAMGLYRDTACLPHRTAAWTAAAPASRATAP